MPNNFFRFKQFTVYQDKAAMKVCTDACLFGAWVASFTDPNTTSILDVGSGTGLLSLMLAQNTFAEIQGIDIDPDAFTQTATNFENSPWGYRMHATESSLQDYFPARLYDLVVCNPPFYSQDLKSPDEKRNIALHGVALPLRDLLAGVARLLNNTGRFTLLLPERRATDLEKALPDFSLTIERRCGVKQSPAHTPFRYMYLIARKDEGDALLQEDIITIRDGNQNYTDRFRQLLKDYYLFEK